MLLKWQHQIYFYKERNIKIYSDVDDQGSDNLLVELRNLEFTRSVLGTKRVAIKSKALSPRLFNIPFPKLEQ